jgi:hypothetical protein
LSSFFNVQADSEAQYPLIQLMLEALSSEVNRLGVKMKTRCSEMQNLEKYGAIPPSFVRIHAMMLNEAKLNYASRQVLL